MSKFRTRRPLRTRGKIILPILIFTWIFLVTGTWLHGMMLNLQYGYSGWIIDSIWGSLGWALTLAGPLLAKAFLQNLTPAFFLGAFVGGATYSNCRSGRTSSLNIQQGLWAAILVPLLIPVLLMTIGPMILSYTVFQPRNFFTGDFDEINCCEVSDGTVLASSDELESGVPWGLAFRPRDSGRPFVDLCGLSSHDDHCKATQKGLAVDFANLEKQEFQLTYQYNSLGPIVLNFHGYEEIIFDRRYGFIIGTKENSSITESLLGLSPTVELHVFNTATGEGPYVIHSAGTNIHQLEIVKRAENFFLNMHASDVNGSKGHKLKNFKEPML